MNRESEAVIAVLSALVAMAELKLEQKRLEQEVIEKCLAMHAVLRNEHTFCLYMLALNVPSKIRNEVVHMRRDSEREQLRYDGITTTHGPE